MRSISLMFQAMISSIAAIAGSGTWLASGAASNTKHRMNSAWAMPATGERAPARTLVAVRTIAPVAGSPPTSAEAVLATPCATSSQLERWRPPIMPSDTTADSSDSTPPRNAIVNALGNSSCTRARSKLGRCGSASSRGTGPKRDTMVSTGSCSSTVASVASTTAMRNAGQCGRQRRNAMSSASVASANALAHGFRLPMWLA